MLDNNVIRRIEEFVYTKPCTIQEISKHIKKSWRTADRYVDTIAKEFGTIAVRTFREGSRGALKIVYSKNVNKVSNTVFQQILEQQIFAARRKEDFSAFDIFQHVADTKKQATMEKAAEVNEFAEVLASAKRQVLIFSGNLSFVNLKHKNVDLFKIVDDLVKRGVSVKVLTRVDLPGKENVEKILSLNFKYGTELIEVRHGRHPLRSVLADNKVFTIKEIKEPTGKINELQDKISIFYRITDRDWAEWMSRIFWKMFSSSVDANKRIAEIKKLK
ncbi:hypothetical protein KY330_05105 [Candidatus Woesearchaeota archaeon]|nr:hypothetical protein [Candidatus Woesearchaeota archaeon]